MTGLHCYAWFKWCRGWNPGLVLPEQVLYKLSYHPVLFVYLFIIAAVNVIYLFETGNSIMREEDTDYPNEKIASRQ